MNLTGVLRRRAPFPVGKDHVPIYTSTGYKHQDRGSSCGGKMVILNGEHQAVKWCCCWTCFRACFTNWWTTLISTLEVNTGTELKAYWWVHTDFYTCLICTASHITCSSLSGKLWFGETVCENSDICWCLPVCWHPVFWLHTIPQPKDIVHENVQ